MEHSKTVKRIAALFICCVIMVGVFLPFFVYSYNNPVYYLQNNNFYTVIDGYYNLSVSATNNDTTQFTGVYVDVWDETISDYRVVELSYISVSDYYYNPPIGQSQHIYYWNGYVYYNNVYVQFKGGQSTVYRSLQNNITSNAPHYFYITDNATKLNSGYELYFTYSSNQSQTWFDLSFGYTLTFDSKGGSSIAAESGVTDVILGDSTGYFPQYIPTRSGYEFLGWSLTPGGTYVRQVSLTEDTTIYANWRVNDGWCQVSFPDNSTIQLYLEGMIALPSNIAVQNNHNFSVYYYNPISIPDYGIFFDEWIVTEQLTDVTVIETLHGTLYDETNDIYKLDLSVTGNDLTVVPKIYYPHTCKLRWDSSLDNYITVSDGSNTYSNGDIIDYYGYHGLDLTFNVEFPYMYCRMILYEEAAAPVVLPDDYLTYYGYADDDSNSVYNYNVHIDSPVDCVLLMNADAIDIDYDPNDPVVSFDESGNAHWVISAEDSFMDVDWDNVYSIIPSDFNGIMGTVFNLKGLAIIGSICFVAAFAIWFVRRGG